MIQKYAEEFNAQPKSGTSWLDLAKQNAMQRFVKEGFPTMRMEEWKDINLSSVTGKFFASPLKPVAQKIEGFWKKFPHILFYNGFQTENTVQIQGVKIQKFANGIEKFQSAFDLKPRDAHAFFDLNTSMVREGVTIQIEKNAVVNEPIYLVYVSESAEQAYYYRNLIMLGQHAQAHIVEVYMGSKADSSLTIPVTQIHLSAGAHLEHVKYQNQGSQSSHAGVVLADLSEQSKLKNYSFSFGGGLTRNDIQIGLNQPHSECVIDGLYVVSGKQTVDHHTIVNHAKPHCISSQIYKGVLLDQSHGIFEGKIVVSKDAQKTDAKQLNQNLLLSSDAQIHTAPQLEILADDVKCSHGATIGNLDEEQLFYMRSRGIDAMTARKILVQAYAHDIFSKIQIPSVVEELQQTLTTKILNV